MSPRNVDWDFRIGRHLKLRDLQVLFAVVQLGSMAKAASHLSVTQPAMSQVSLGRRLPVVAVTLKSRTLTPSVQLFIDEAHATTTRVGEPHRRPRSGP
jgi:hypothetical protein